MSYSNETISLENVQECFNDIKLVMEQNKQMEEHIKKSSEKHLAQLEAIKRTNPNVYLLTIEKSLTKFFSKLEKNKELKAQVTDESFKLIDNLHHIKQTSHSSENFSLQIMEQCFAYIETALGKNKQMEKTIIETSQAFLQELENIQDQLKDH